MVADVSTQDLAGYPPVQDLVLHRAPMMLLDRVTSYDEDHIVCEYQIKAKAAFVDQGRVDAVVALEYMAQTIAAYVGLKRRRDGLLPRIGYLISAREFTLQTDHFFVGDQLRIEAQRLWGEQELGHFRCRVSRASAEVAVGQLSVYQPPDHSDV